MQRKNFKKDYPQIHKTAYIDSAAIIIGKVKIGRNVFVAPGAVIRADEPKSSIIIGDNCNVQDRVIIHALTGSKVIVGKNSSLAHGCIVHGPVKIGRNCFIGFGSVVFDAQIEDGVIIKHLSCIEKVKIPSGKVVTSGSLINTQRDARELKDTDKNLKNFTNKVVKVNLSLIKRYKRGRLCSLSG